MNIVGAYIFRDSLGRAIRALSEMAGDIRPFSFSEDEAGKYGRGEVVDGVVSELFIKKNHAGFFLFSKSMRYNISLRNNSEIATIFVDSIVGDISFFLGADILRALSRGGLRFGFFCHNDEYIARNQYRTQVGSSVINAWVGRDFPRYLPGLYWSTVVAKEEFFRLKINPDDLGAPFDGAGFPDEFIFYRFFEMADDWVKNKAILDERCRVTSGIFSILRIHQELALASKNFMQLSSILQQWR